ncbi:MAG: ankyrin repeat domain-containing protein [Thiovulaceae bacterium]|nr:ankyrin repeat domain-containing protein [Sulfurimonadaceae bacterium]
MRLMIFFLFTLNLALAGFSEIHDAIMFNDIKKVQSLIDNDLADIDEKTGSGLTPLHIAVKVRSIQIATFLLAKGADIDSTDDQGYTPLHLAVKKKRINLVKFLVNKGADTNVKNTYGITPLHQAAFSDQLEIVEYLIAHGANPKVKNINGSTPYDLAVAKKNANVSSVLSYYEQE